MRAIELEWAIAARGSTSLLSEIADVVGGPFHLIHPQTFGENLMSFQEVLKQNGVMGSVYYGKKANKAGAWMREIARHDGCVDVASAPEFAHALTNGIRGENIGVTGAAKSDELLWLSARHKALLAIDALDELERALKIAADAGALRILLRVLPPDAPNSRFGLNPADLAKALRTCGEHRSLVHMEGFSFHLDGYAVARALNLPSI